MSQVATSFNNVRYAECAVCKIYIKPGVSSIGEHISCELCTQYCVHCTV